MRPPRPLTLGALVAVAALAGCATTSPDTAIEPVQQQLRQHTGATLTRWPDAQAPSAETQQRLRTLLATPLTMDGAVEVALLHHRGLQASLADLGVTQAELAQTTRLPNP
ncbi:MAG: RND transporter, partial [Sphaerotilus sp.]|nr:RND transporter [Sphaerotilus sp.]